MASVNPEKDRSNNDAPLHAAGGLSPSKPPAIENLITIAVEKDGRCRIRTSKGNGEYGRRIIAKLLPLKGDQFPYVCSEGKSVQFLSGDINFGIHHNIKEIFISKQKTDEGRVAFYADKILNSAGHEIKLPAPPRQKEKARSAGKPQTASSVIRQGGDEDEPVILKLPDRSRFPMKEDTAKSEVKKAAMPEHTKRAEKSKAADERQSTDLHPIPVTEKTEQALWNLLLKLAKSQQSALIAAEMKKDVKQRDLENIKAGWATALLIKSCNDKPAFRTEALKKGEAIDKYLREHMPPLSEGRLGKQIQIILNPKNPEARPMAAALIEYFTALKRQGTGFFALFTQEGRTVRSLRLFTDVLLKQFGADSDQQVSGVENKNLSMQQLLARMESKNRIIAQGALQRVEETLKREAKNRPSDASKLAERNSMINKVVETAQRCALEYIPKTEERTAYCGKLDQIKLAALRDKGDYGYEVRQAQAQKLADKEKNS